MRWFVAPILLCSALPAQAQFTAHDLGKQGFNVPAAAVSAYSGPGDVVTFSGWYSCTFGYKGTYAAPGTNPACDVVDSATGATSCTLHVQSSGSVTQTECDATACATACKVKKAYDQTGNGLHLTQATLADMPVYHKSAIGSLPIMDTGSISAGTIGGLSGTITDTAQPNTIAGVMQRVSATSGSEFDEIRFTAGTTNNTTNFMLGTNPNTFQIKSNSITVVQTNNATDGKLIANSGEFNGASSVAYQNGFSTTGTAGTISSQTLAKLVYSNVSGTFQFYVGEAGFLLGSTLGSTNRTNLCKNEQSRWGTSNFSATC